MGRFLVFAYLFVTTIIAFPIMVGWAGGDGIEIIFRDSVAYSTTSIGIPPWRKINPKALPPRRDEKGLTWWKPVLKRPADYLHCGKDVIEIFIPYSIGGMTSGCYVDMNFSAGKEDTY